MLDLVALLELGKHQPGQENVYRRFLDTQQAALQTQEEIAAAEPTDEVQRALFRAARSGSAIGSPDTIRENIRKYEEQHLDTLILVAQCGDRKHEHIMEAIELFGTQVLPEFKERHEVEHKAWRKQQLDGVDFPINSSI